MPPSDQLHDHRRGISGRRSRRHHFGGPALGRYAVPFSIAFVVILAFGNLRGIREAGRVFAVPTYFFIANMALLIVVGLGRKRPATSRRRREPRNAAPRTCQRRADPWRLGVLPSSAFANGSSAMTGTEAISNGVSIFREPQASNARTTLVLMSTILGAMFLGVSVLAALTHSVPFVSGTPTVVSEIGKLVYGSSAAGHALFYSLQAATALILILAANTSFTGFPFLVSFVAEDSFLPRKLTVRGHRLVFSNGILLLAGGLHRAPPGHGGQGRRPDPDVRHRRVHRIHHGGGRNGHPSLAPPRPHWRKGVIVNAMAAFVCAVVVVVFAVAEFTQGAWVVVVVMPSSCSPWCGRTASTGRRTRSSRRVRRWRPARPRYCDGTWSSILVDKIDLATARAIQYARTLTPDDLHAVHFNIDDKRAELLISRWQQLGLARLPLDVIDCPDRRLGRAALELAAELADGETEVSMLLPRRSYGKTWRRVLHDQTADRIVDIVSQLPHVNATIIPFHVAPGLKEATLVVQSLLDEAMPQRASRPDPGVVPSGLEASPRSEPSRSPLVALAGQGGRADQDPSGSAALACPPSSACSSTGAARRSPSSSSVDDRSADSTTDRCSPPRAGSASTMASSR